MNIESGVGLLSIAINPPKAIRTNDYYRQTVPDVVASAESGTLARMFRTDRQVDPSDLLAVEMVPYANDPFKGAVERRVLGEGETVLSLELGAARRAMAAARCSAGDIDLAISVSFVPDQIGVGNASRLARDLGLKCVAWNLESTCSGGVVAFQTASALVKSGMYRTVLVTVSCTYSRTANESDSLSWFLGDGVASFIVGKVPHGEGLLGSSAGTTSDSIETFNFEKTTLPTSSGLVMTSQPGTGKILHESIQRHLHVQTDRALKDASLTIKDIDFVVTNSAAPWFAPWITNALGLDISQTIDTYASYANVGAAHVPMNLFTAAAEGKIKKGDRVLVYSFGGVSNATAVVMRWGDVKLGE